MITKLAKRALNNLGYAVNRTRGRYAGDGLFSVHQPRFVHDPKFGPAYRRGVEASLGVDPDFQWRIHIALWAAAQSLRVDGDFIECGVNAGFVSSAIMRYLNWESLDRNFYLIDTFQGPDFSQYSQAEIDAGRAEISRAALSAGSYVSDMERVRANYREWTRAVIVQGAIPQVLSSVRAERVAFMHIDLNCAAPEVAALKFFWDRLSEGGAVLFDDYAYAECYQQGESLDEAARAIGAGKILSLPTGQGLMIK